MVNVVSVHMKKLGAASGLGDIVNTFAALLPKDDEEIEVVNDCATHHYAAVLDILLYRPRVHLVQESLALDVTRRYEDAFVTPSLPTRLFFSEEEIATMYEVLTSVYFHHDPTPYLVVCPNTPAGTHEKKMSLSTWMEFINEYINGENTVIITPTFSDGDEDCELEEMLRTSLGIEVVNLQERMVRNSEVVARLRERQSVFGVSRNNHGFSFRQDAALYHLLLHQPYQGLFNDSAPAHIAAAASGKPVVSGLALAPCYTPHNGGYAWRVLQKNDDYLAL